MSSRKVTLCLNADVVEKAKKLGINFNAFLEVKLVEYIGLVNCTPRGRFELLRGQVPTSSPRVRRKTVFLYQEYRTAIETSG